MKSFKYYISESEGIQSLVHPSEKKSLDMVGYKSWITPEGKVINLPHAAANHGEYHHIHMVVDHPELFGTTSEKLESLDPENYPALTQTTNLGYRKFTWNAPIVNDLARRGYIRVHNQSYANEGHPEHGSIMKHVFQLSHHDYQSEESLKAFVPALKKIRETIVQTQIHPKHDVVRITLESKDNKNWQRYSHQLRSLSDIDGFLGNDEPKHTSVTELPDVPRQMNSTQRRAMLGRTPPEGSNVPQAIWNNMRTIGDSYTPMMGFKQYISENESKPERKDIFHSFFVSKHGDIIEPTTPPLQAHMRNVDHLYIPLVHPEKFGMSDREMDDVLELDDQEKLGLFKTGQGPMDASVDRRLSSRGFIRAINGAYEDPYSAPERRRITLAATTTGTADRHHLDHLTPAIKAIRGRLSDHPDWKMKIYGLKFHEPHELEAMKHRLSPSHIQQLTDGSEIEFNNTDEIDRFIHGHGKISRDPGSGVEPIPTPEQMRRKAGRTDEPESIQRGRFFQSDSYNPIMGFKKYIH